MNKNMKKMTGIIASIGVIGAMSVNVFAAQPAIKLEPSKAKAISVEKLDVLDINTNQEIKMTPIESTFTIQKIDDTTFEGTNQKTGEKITFTAIPATKLTKSMESIDIQVSKK